MERKPYPEEDLQFIVDSVNWDPLCDAKILLTGGTGLIGSWLVQSFLKANRQPGLGAEMFSLSRHTLSIPRNNQGPVKYLTCDIQHYMPEYLETRFTHVIHAACPASAKLTSEKPLEMWDIVVDGTRNVLDWATRQKRLKSLLYVSSGAATDKPGNVYGEAKHAAEVLCEIYYEKFGLPISTARPYSLVGPGMPLDAHYAIGNFIRDAIVKGNVVLNGGEGVMRSHLYISDAVATLWRTLLGGVSDGPVLVGSPNGVTIKELAFTVAEALSVPVDVYPEPIIFDHYYPSPSGVWDQQTVGLRDAIQKTARYYGWNG